MAAGKLEKGSISYNGKEIKFLFNPKEYTIEKSNQFASVNIPGIKSPLLQFVRGNIKGISMDLFFDTYEEGKDVHDLTKKVTDLMNIDPKTGAPPVCLFSWKKIKINCIVESVTQRFTMFLSDGTPVRATLSVRLKEFVTPGNPNPTQNPTGSVSHRIVRQSDTLSGISGEEYGDPRMWRLIADANDIENPRELETGKSLIIPPSRE